MSLRSGTVFGASNDRLLSPRPFSLLVILADQTGSLDPAYDDFYIPIR